MNEYIIAEGEIIELSDTIKVPEEMYTVTYFTLTYKHLKKKKYETEHRSGYYTFVSYSTKMSSKLSKGIILKCRLRRESKMWTVEGAVKMKEEYINRQGEKIYVGTHPYVFENYVLDEIIEMRMPKLFNVPDGDETPF